MKRSLRNAASTLALLISITPLFAGETAFELGMGYSYTGGAKTGLDNGRSGDVTEQATQIQCVITPALDEEGGLLLRLGVDWLRFSFGLPSEAPLPNTLQSESLVIGVDFQLSESWLMRAEASPGIYGDLDSLHGNSFNVPVVLGAFYLQSAEVQWLFGLRMNPWGRWPVMPGLGVRWQFAEKWVLNAIPPAPRLEYKLSKKTTLFGGARIGGGTYRMDGQFGSSHGDDQLNNAILNYFEVRAGVGATWKATRCLTLEIEGGWLPYRTFDFHRAGVEYSSDGGAPYAQISLGGKF